MEVSMIIFAVLAIFHLVGIALSIRNSLGISPIKKDLERMISSHDEKYRFLESLLRSNAAEIKEQHAFLSRISENVLLMGSNVEKSTTSGLNMATSMNNVAQDQKHIAKVVESVNKTTSETKGVLNSISDRLKS